MPILLGLLLAAFIITLGAMWSGYVVSILWVWFVMPLGVKAITVSQAIGLSAMISVFLGSRGIADTSGQEPGKVMLNVISYAIMIPAFALLIGWIVK